MRPVVHAGVPDAARECVGHDGHDPAVGPRREDGRYREGLGGVARGERGVAGERLELIPVSSVAGADAPDGVLQDRCRDAGRENLRLDRVAAGLEEPLVVREEAAPSATTEMPTAAQLPKGVTIRAKSSVCFERWLCTHASIRSSRVPTKTRPPEIAAASAQSRLSKRDGSGGDGAAVAQIALQLGDESGVRLLGKPRSCRQESEGREGRERGGTDARHGAAGAATRISKLPDTIGRRERGFSAVGGGGGP